MGYSTTTTPTFLTTTESAQNFAWGCQDTVSGMVLTQHMQILVLLGPVQAIVIPTAPAINPFEIPMRLILMDVTSALECTQAFLMEMEILPWTHIGQHMLLKVPADLENV